MAAVSTLVFMPPGENHACEDGARLCIGLDLASTAPVEEFIKVEVDALGQDALVPQLLQLGLREALKVFEIAEGCPVDHDRFGSPVILSVKRGDAERAHLGGPLGGLHADGGAHGFVSLEGQ